MFQPGDRLHVELARLLRLVQQNFDLIRDLLRRARLVQRLGHGRRDGDHLQQGLQIGQTLGLELGPALARGQHLPQPCRDPLGGFGALLFGAHHGVLGIGQVLSGHECDVVGVRRVLHGALVHALQRRHARHQHVLARAGQGDPCPDKLGGRRRVVAHRGYLLRGGGQVQRHASDRAPRVGPEGVQAIADIHVLGVALLKKRHVLAQGRHAPQVFRQV
uniref:Uncharacterized protein n=1 Tax=Human herpesvirus 1 TaxID=10298 RepID=A0A2Z4HB22_HHV1|nr:hypothetical protein [Human alphaherpesvirus 1]